jgi:uncharacterized protein YqgC (DUF456 family)
MGVYFFDQYSILHFSVGVIMYFWGFSLWISFVIHTIFELFENTQFGMNFINNYFTLWPGGKPYADSNMNSFGDTIFFLLGYIISMYLDEIMIRKEYYPRNLVD